MVQILLQRLIFKRVSHYSRCRRPWLNEIMLEESPGPQV